MLGARWGNLPVPPDPFHRSASRTVASLLPIPAREEAEQREHKDDDQDDPEDAHALGASLAVGVDLTELISVEGQRETAGFRYG